MAETQKQQAGTWILIAPDGRRFEAETPMLCARNELHDRVPASVALERIMAESDDNDIGEYEAQTIGLIRERGWRLNKKTDEEIAALYHEWSEESACAGWLMHDDMVITSFCEWATTAPCDRERT